MKMLSRILPNDLKKRRWTAVLITICMCTPLMLWSIYEINEYGILLFFLIPLLIGIASTILLGFERNLSRKEARNIGFLTLFVFTSGLIVFAVEGLICIAMAAPFVILITWIGTLIGHTIITRKPNQSLNILIAFCILSVVTGFTEKSVEPMIKPVSTKIVIDAPIEEVWDNVIAFPELDEPAEFMFRFGISYPISSRIEGKGVGAVRYCQFNTGAFVEPITSWEENKHLAFDVESQPLPLKEVSFWDIDAPHLHDYFVSKKGQFKLSERKDGRVELEGTTWYYHDIKPDFYWRLWSNYIIHKIHERVLSHIKYVSENGKSID